MVCPKNIFWKEEIVFGICWILYCAKLSGGKYAACNIDGEGLYFYFVWSFLGVIRWSVTVSVAVGKRYFSSP